MSAQPLTAALRETLAFFARGGEPLTTKEVANSLDVGRRSTYERLERLVEKEYLETKKVGASARVWWRPTAPTTGVEGSSSVVSNQQNTEPGVPTHVAQSERERNEFESELGRILDRISDGFYVLDDQLRFLYLNEHAMDVLSLDESAVGRNYLEVVTVMDAFREALNEAQETQETVVFENYYDPVDRWFYNAIYPSQDGLSVYFRDITERKEHELQLERYAGIINAVGEPVYELDTEGRFTFVNEPFVEQSGYSEEELLGEHVSVGMDDEAVARSEAEILTLFTEDSEGTAVLEYEVVTKSGDRIPAENRISLVTDDDGAIRGSAGVLRDISERKQRERELERQREQVAALNNLNETVREITDRVIEGSTRNEIERAACEGLVNSDSYTFAWIADVDPQTQRIQPRIETGFEGYLDEIDLSADPEKAVGQGPAGRAVRTGEMQVSTDVFEDTTFEPWWEYAKEYGYSAFAAIPITHESTTFGLLGIYSEREGAFEASERSVVGQLGEIVGHAIAAADRKQALMSDEVIELQFRIRNLFDAFDLDVSTAGRISIQHTIPVGDDEYLHYGTATADAVDTVESLVDSHSSWRDVRFWGDDERTFELRVSSPPVLSKVAAIGGSVESAVIEDGSYHTTIHVAPSADVRQLIEVFHENYPNAELVKRQQISRREQSAEIDRTAVESQLTSSQRKALETAIYSGYFEWPRELSGQEVADSLGIAPSTFSQHLRKAQKNVFTSLFPISGSERGGS